MIHTHRKLFQREKDWIKDMEWSVYPENADCPVFPMNIKWDIPDKAVDNALYVCHVGLAL